MKNYQQLYYNHYHLMLTTGETVECTRQECFASTESPAADNPFIQRRHYSPDHELAIWLPRNAMGDATHKANVAELKDQERLVGRAAKHGNLEIDKPMSRTDDGEESGFNIPDDADGPVQLLIKKEMHTAILTPTRKSRFNANRNCYRTRDGRYAYITWDDEQRRNVTHYLEVGKDGVTEEMLIFLDEDDHDVDLQERYDTENADYAFQNKQASHDCDPAKISDPLTEIVDKDADIFASLFPAEESVDETMAQLIAAMDKLTDAQHDLIYEHFGARKTLEEIRQAEIAATGKEITQQAVSNRLKKIITRLCKELDTPVSRKRTPKNED